MDDYFAIVFGLFPTMIKKIIQWKIDEEQENDDNWTTTMRQRLVENLRKGFHLLNANHH